MVVALLSTQPLWKYFKLVALDRAQPANNHHLSGSFLISAVFHSLTELVSHQMPTLPEFFSPKGYFLQEIVMDATTGKNPNLCTMPSLSHSSILVKVCA
jgi:hypothetical protein